MADGTLRAVRSACDINARSGDKTDGLMLTTPLPEPSKDYVDALIDEESRQMGEMMWSSNIVEMH